VPGLESERVVSPQPSALDQVDQHEAIDRVRAAMEHLSEEHREIIVLRHFQDLSYSEIADLLGVAKGTVMSRLYRARRALARLLSEEDPA